MEGYGDGLKGYWKRRNYQRLEGSSTVDFGRKSRVKNHRVELDSATAAGCQRKRRFWRIKITPRLKFLHRTISSPRRFLVRIRDAYVRMMLKLASSGGLGGGFGYGGGGIGWFAWPPIKEYDEKIYKSLIAQGHLIVTSTAAGKDGVPTAQIVARR